MRVTELLATAAVVAVAGAPTGELWSGPSEAWAGSYAMRPGAKLKSAWDAVGAPSAWRAIDDPVTAPSPVGSDDYIRARGRDRVVDVVMPVNVPAGETPVKGRAWFFARTGRRTQTRVEVIWGGSVRGRAVIRRSSRFRWRSIGVDPPRRSGSKVRIRFKTRMGRAAQVRAAYFELLTAPGESIACPAFGTFSSSNPPGACWRPYSDRSPFNRPLPSAPPTVPDSATIVGRTVGFGPPQNISAGQADTRDDYGHPLYFSQPADPLYTVHCTRDWGTCEIEGMQVRIPAAARPAAGGDGSLAVIDQAAGWEYDFYEVADKPPGGGTITVAWGGRTPIGTPEADGLDSNATAAHFGLAAGIIRGVEMEAGAIYHALFMVVECTNGTSVWPAGTGTGRSCSSIGLPDAGAPAMGQHFYLDMSESEIAALPEPEWKKTILRAMARYGMFVGDTGGSSWHLKIESGSSYTSFGHEDPWVGFGREVGVPTWLSPETGATHHVFNIREVVDWGGHLRVADPCVSQGAC